MKKLRIDAELFMGHKNFAAVLVRFAPERVWRATPTIVDAPYSRKPHRRPSAAQTRRVAVGDIVELVVTPRDAPPRTPKRAKAPQPKRRGSAKAGRA